MSRMELSHSSQKTVSSDLPSVGQIDAGCFLESACKTPI